MWPCVQWAAVDERSFYAPLCSYLYLHTLRYLPALSRMWWSTRSARGHSAAVTKFTGKYFSPILIRDEIAAISRPAATAGGAAVATAAAALDDDERDGKSDTDFKIRANVATAEVVA